MRKYLFESPLVEGVIKSRPNRFIMMAEIDGRLEKCHCPSTGQIASIGFENVPCLVSKAKGGVRKTGFTVEAISLQRPADRKKGWIGINQTKANEYVDFFLRSGQLGRLFPKVADVRREVTLRKSRIDFLVNGRDFLEVKTLLMDIPSENHPNYRPRKSKFVSFDRLIKHFNDISRNAGVDSRAILLLCNMYDAKPFRPPAGSSKMRIVRVARRAVSRGLEQWQINLSIDREGICLIDYFRLNLF